MKSGLAPFKLKVKHISKNIIYATIKWLKRDVATEIESQTHFQKYNTIWLKKNSPFKLKAKHISKNIM